jgi:hypothetical protein
MKNFLANLHRHLLECGLIILLAVELYKFIVYVAAGR